MSEKDITDRCLMHLRRQLGDRIEVTLEELELKTGNRRYDSKIRIGNIEVFVEVKGQLNGIRPILNFSKLHPVGGLPLLFLLPHLELKHRLELEENNINYIDTAGNCNVDLPGVKLLVNVRDDAPVDPPYSGVAFQRKGVILLYHFLVAPQLVGASYRTISEQTGVSTGAISGILDDLRKQGFLIEVEGKRTLHNLRGLIERWAYAYLWVLRPSLHRGYFRSRDGDLIERAQLSGINDRLLLGGQYAVMMLGDYLSSENTVIYSSLRLSELSKRYGLRPVGKDQSETDTELLSPFWHFEVSPQETWHQSFTADILTYADLLLSHDSRVLEAAQKYLNHEIRDRFQNAGLQW
ncbi:type IV toxin-antitoxin system AbiEi family antitoxin [Neolewinella aurantiaca]|nr:type IV toxin-antitoxin system AbiEi family antitoxin [Neolewinella aurantiaca]